MKIIQMPRRESIALFLKILCVAIILFCVFKAIEFIYDFSGFKTIEYNDSEQVLRAFKENESDFNSMVEVLTKTEITKTLYREYVENPTQIMICPGDNLKNPKYQIRRRGLLKKDDYRTIARFFKKYAPIYIEGRSEYCFTFDTKEGTMYLFYIPQDESDKLLLSLRHYFNEIMPIKENWYFSK